MSVSFEHCQSCLPPTRYPGCQDHCPYYAEDIAKVRAAKAEEKRQTQEKDDYLSARQFKTRRGQKLRK